MILKLMVVFFAGAAREITALPTFAPSAELPLEILTGGERVAASTLTIENMTIGALGSAALWAVAVIIARAPIGVTPVGIGTAGMGASQIRQRSERHDKRQDDGQTHDALAFCFWGL